MVLRAPPYGRDTSCTTQMRRGVIVSGGRLLGEATFRRYTTDRGTLLYDPNYGLLITRLINADMTQSELNSIQGQLRTEAMKDRRLDEVAVNCTQRPIGTSPGVELEIDVEGRGLDGSTFSFGMLVSEVRVELLRMEGN